MQPRRESNGLGPNRTPRGDDAILAVGSRDWRAGDPEHPDPTPCADARHCSDALSALRKHQTELNALYWSFVPVEGYVTFLAKHASPTATTSGLFHASGPDIRRLASRLADWRVNF